MKIGYLSDGMTLATGFARVARHIIPAFAKAGHEVAQICGQQYGPHVDRQAYLDAGVTPWFTDARDRIGLGLFDEFLQAEKPDLLFINYQPAVLLEWFKARISTSIRIPTVAYTPIEGRPLAMGYREVLKRVDRVVVYTQWARNVLQEECGIESEVAGHGVDFQEFYPGEVDQRIRLREKMGLFPDERLLMFVGRNKLTKGIDRLLQALTILRGSGEEYLLYVHTGRAPEFSYWGHDLEGIAQVLGVRDAVVFPEPNFNEVCGVNGSGSGLASLTLRERYIAADVYVSASMVEGFGLPLVESMACGTPVIAPRDGGVQEEVVGEAGVLVDPGAWITLWDGAQAAVVHPGALVEAIRSLQNTGFWEEKRKQGIIRSTKFSWETAQEAILETCQKTWMTAVTK